MPHISISKSLYLRGLQCQKSLWLHKHRPELRDASDDSREASFALRHRVGDLAKELYPGGVEIEFDAKNFKGMIQKTRDLIDQGCRVIYEATFEREGILVLVDILVKKGEHWEILEVKSSSSVKDYQVNDTGVQWYVVGKSLPVKEAAVVHIDTSYVRKGELDVAKLFVTDYNTDQVIALQEDIPLNLKEMTKTLEGGEPDIDIGEWCSSPFICDFHGHCWSHIPKSSVFNLYRLPGEKKFSLYHEGVIELNQIADDYPLTETQRLQVEAQRTGRTFLDSGMIKSFIQKLIFPITFLDFETFSEAIPRFDGQRPYQQVPFQYSMHIMDQSGSIEHKEFLGSEFSDPRREFIEDLLENIPQTGTILAYNASFEKMILRMMAGFFPDLSNKIDSLLDRFEDLLEPFRSRGYYHPDFNGSFSIKSVLPAMFPGDPDLDYKSLEIQNGQMAMDTFATLHLEKSSEKRARVREALLAYCKLDTLAMVKIYEKLKSLSEEER